MSEQTSNVKSGGVDGSTDKFGREIPKEGEVIEIRSFVDPAWRPASVESVADGEMVLCDTNKKEWRTRIDNDLGWRWPVPVEMTAVDGPVYVPSLAEVEEHGSASAAADAKIAAEVLARFPVSDARAERAVKWALAEKAAADEFENRRAAHDPAVALEELAKVHPWGRRLFEIMMPALGTRELLWDGFADNPNFDPLAVSIAKDLSDRQLCEVIERAATRSADEGVLSPLHFTVWRDMVRTAGTGLETEARTKVATWKRAANLHVDTMGRLLRTAALALVDADE